MISLQSKLRQIGLAFQALPIDNVKHYFRPVKKLPALIWAEDGEENSFHADNRKECQNITGKVDYYTKTQFDPVMDQVQDILDELGPWYLEAVQYEDETQTIHYTWHWEVSTRGES